MSQRDLPPARPWATGLLLMLVACAPPETRRVQGGDRGADIGNRSAVVEMHAGSVIYPEERCAVRGEACTGPLPRSGREPARFETTRFQVRSHVLEEMGRGGAIRRVIYQPPPDLASRDTVVVEGVVP